MGTNANKVGTLTIASAGTDSPVFDAHAYDAIAIEAPATLPETITIRTPGGGTLQSPPGTDIVIAAGKTVELTKWEFDSFTLHAAGAVGGARAFNIYASF